MNDERLQDVGVGSVFNAFCFSRRLVFVGGCFRGALVVFILSVVSLLSVTTGQIVRAASPPIVDYLYPAGAQRGTTVTVVTDCIFQPPIGDGTIAKLEPWPVGVWTNCQELKITPGETCGEFQVQVSDVAPLGTHLIRLYTPNGVSVPRRFIVGHYPEIMEMHSDAAKETITPLERMPITVNGRLRRPPYFDDVGRQKWDGDVDSYGVHLEAGRWLVARLHAYSIGSPVDSLLQLRDEKGRVLATNHDHCNLDPLLAYQVEESGNYVIQVMGFKWPPRGNPGSQRVKFVGSDAAVYRLTVTSEAFGRYVFPLGVQPGLKTMVTLHGWNLGSSGRLLQHELNVTEIDPSVKEVLIGPPVVANQLSVAVSDVPELLDTEPNDQREQAQSMVVPAVLNGRIGGTGDVDRFVFQAAKDEKIVFQFATPNLGLSLSGSLRIENEKGELVVEKTTPPEVPQWVWTPPTDGLFTLAVSDLGGRGGEDYVYRLEVFPALPGNGVARHSGGRSLFNFDVRADAHSYRVEPGQTVPMKVSIRTVEGVEATMGVVLEGLPGGVKWTTTQVPRSGGDVALELSADADAAPANVPIRVRVTSHGPSLGWERSAFALIDNRGENRLIDQTDVLWLTVLPLPLAEPDKVVKDGS